MQMTKHDKVQFLFESIETAREHIPFKIETLIAFNAEDQPVLIVQRVHETFAGPNYPASKHREIIVVLSVNAEAKLHLWNCTSHGMDFDAVSQPLIFPEQYAPAEKV